MTILQAALVEKTARDNGFEALLAQEGQRLQFASMHHSLQVQIEWQTVMGYQITLTDPSPRLLAELRRSLSSIRADDRGNRFGIPDDLALAKFLRRAAELSLSLPNQTEQHYQQQLQAELQQLPAPLRGTEVERLVRQRLGQHHFREAMLHYWGGACAVTGITLPEVLRASHAKPWAECDSDAERLDVFNGLLLSANLDALFDRFLISFSETGEMLLSDRITRDQRIRMGLEAPLRLRWLTEAHQSYLEYHRYRYNSKPIADPESLRDSYSPSESDAPKH